MAFLTGEEVKVVAGAQGLLISQKVIYCIYFSLPGILLGAVTTWSFEFTSPLNVGQNCLQAVSV